MLTKDNHASEKEHTTPCEKIELFEIPHAHVLSRLSG
jgi:hypothetical protein